jgi:dTDP-4-dehydrorhamnose reductase
MRTLIVGGTGMLGQAVLAAARGRGWPALALSRAQADIEDETRLDYWMAEFRPQVVINCAAFTHVDDCEAESGRSLAVNGEAVGCLARAAGRAGARLLHVSTDYVFDGAERQQPYTEDDAVGPRSAYGRGKLVGEQRALAHGNSLVVRTSWLFGAGGPNFVAAITRQIDLGTNPLRVVSDQLGAPTYTPFLARALVDLAPLAATGIVQYRNREPVSWYSFAATIARWWPGARGVVEVLPVATAEYPRPAPRPAYSVLSVERCEALLGRRVESWELGLAEYLPQLRESRKRGI